MNVSCHQINGSFILSFFFKDMSLYTTPLQFGYCFSLLLWLLFMLRGYKEQRLSDKMLGWIMFILAMELQDYTFGFAGINFLWDELNGFPRGVSLLFGPAIYFYFLSQINRSFTFQKQHLLHLLPYLIFFIYQLSYFVQGPEAVQKQQSTAIDSYLYYFSRVVLWGSYIFYLSKCLNIYKAYRRWSNHQFSNTKLINFTWFRNFLYSMMLWLLCRELMNILDAFLNLDFYQEWWWNLALVAVAFYVGIEGYAQKQPSKIYFAGELPANSVAIEDPTYAPITINNEEYRIKDSGIVEKLIQLMDRDRLYLQPELNLHELAQHLQINAALLSSTINQVFTQNFNDYINTLRIEEFIRLFKEDKNKHFTMLSIAFDSGFNSKATFNRAFKKLKKMSPKEYFAQHSN